jgi:hypothetical protein
MVANVNMPKIDLENSVGIRVADIPMRVAEGIMRTMVE